MRDTAAATIRDARTRARLTQIELAARAGVTQSVVSAYESARREPSFQMMSKLVAAAGFDLTIRLSPFPETTRLRASVNQNGPELVRSLTRLGASNIRLFGSVARGDDGPDSDVDLLVDLAPNVGLFALGRMRTEAERILGTRVDIVPAGDLKTDVAQRVLVEAVPL